MENLWSLFLLYVIGSVVGALMRKTQTPPRPLPEVDPEEVLRRWSQLEEFPVPAAEPEPAAPPVQIKPVVDLPELDIEPPAAAAAPVRAPKLSVDGQEILRGVIWGEILKPPRALKPYRPFHW
ncbi:MAG: hypothetical protein GX182_09580 [Firmicutes bacterium]|jgi:hypothetical protein|nr:hypothetical protein [Bacillota bacterium]